MTDKSQDHTPPQLTPILLIAFPCIITYNL